MKKLFLLSFVLFSSVVLAEGPVSLPGGVVLPHESLIVSLDPLQPKIGYVINCIISTVATQHDLMMRFSVKDDFGWLNGVLLNGKGFDWYETSLKPDNELKAFFLYSVPKGCSLRFENINSKYEFEVKSCVAMPR